MIIFKFNLNIGINYNIKVKLKLKKWIAQILKVNVKSTQIVVKHIFVVIYAMIKQNIIEMYTQYIKYNVYYNLSIGSVTLVRKDF